ncbi:MAG: (2Fe-2S)-binding protein [Holophagaceae bacterium]|nr:(2Fe-2S)-binding protein [Holophagaceae bacterium]
MTNAFHLDGLEVPFQEGQTILQAALAAGRYIPHLCWHPDLGPHGSCRLCTVVISGRPFSSCTQPAMKGQAVACRTPELNGMRKAIMQMLFVEGNHHCPSCEKSGNCRLQATAYDLGMQDSHFPHQFPKRERDMSHPDVFLDRDRCIRCERCVRASRIYDGKDVFGVHGRGMHSTLAVNSPSGLLADSQIAPEDRSIQACPTGALMAKRVGFVVPIGERVYDREPISVLELRKYAAEEVHHG